MSGLGFQVLGFKVWESCALPDYKAFDMAFGFLFMGYGFCRRDLARVYTYMCTSRFVRLSVCLSVCMYVCVCMYVFACFAREWISTTRTYFSVGSKISLDTASK